MAGALAAFNQLEKRQQIMVVVGIPVVIVGLLGYLCWGLLNKLGPDEKIPGFLRRPNGIWVDILAKEAAIATQVAISAEGPSVLKQLEDLREEISLAEDRLPLEAEKTEVRQLIEKLARDIPQSLGKVEFKAVRIIEGGIVKGQDYQPITYQVEIAGDLNGSIKYIDSIEKNTRFMMVKSFTLHPGALSRDSDTKQVTSGLHQVNMEIVTYVYTASQKKKSK